ncbi:type I polyketide synthase [Myxococcus fulvus]|uniref:type I polyketide synthase n=1 Tax=Myxococcus fulvus TaxID=33 RepID=UPI00237BFE91|nr:type I polyketide synthase [Myxococcus fulvus]
MDTGGQELQGIALIGMAGRFPGAESALQLWENLIGGVDSISRFRDEELLAAGVPAEVLRNPAYVRAKGVIADADCFDAGFFDFSPREAQLLDPQQRVFLESAWAAFEDAGYDPTRLTGMPVGVFGGVGLNSYLYTHLARPGVPVPLEEFFAAFISNDKDFLSTRVSYKLNLRGPSLTVQTACSTSLVAVHLACQSLLSFESDMALAGGAAVTLPLRTGYLHNPNFILSKDGATRTFDARAGGTVFSHGVGCVVLKRLEDAVRDGDAIYAVIKGSAVNNDGASKVGYTAPSVDSQAEVIRTAYTLADVDPASVAYVEAHGTATPMGDPIEVAALTRAFAPEGPRETPFLLGSVKSNLGHTDAAAGVAGLMKVALSLRHGAIPPSLHFEKPNPHLDLESGNFRVVTQPTPWPELGAPRRAGVSAFGIGGTNAHVVLEEAPAQESLPASQGEQLLVLSARTPEALERARLRLAGHLRREPSVDLGDVAFTLAMGRKLLPYRASLVAADVAQAAGALEARPPVEPVAARQTPVAFLFPGQGSQYASMGRGLYETEPEYRDTVDRCAALLRPHLGLDLREVLHAEASDAATERLARTELTQPSLFVVEYALARLLMSRGVEPSAMLGHSVGEWVAACLAGVFPLEDGLRLIALRGKLMQALPPGKMLSVPLPREEVRSLLNERLSLAAVNGPASCVVAGHPEAVDALAATLSGRGVQARALRTSHAFHSYMVDDALAAFRRVVEQVTLSAPRIPFVSNLTGRFITPAEATSPDYWVRHMREAVEFARGVGTLLREERVLLEVGPGNGLGALARMLPEKGATATILSTMRHPKAAAHDGRVLLETLGRLWEAGGALDLAALWREAPRRRVHLPTYPFERQRHWVEAPTEAPVAAARDAHEGLFHVTTWAPLPRPSPRARVEGERWLWFLDDSELAREALAKLGVAAALVTRVESGDVFERREDGLYRLRPGSREDHQRLVEALAKEGRLPDRVVHAWSVTGPSEASLTPSTLGHAQERGLYSLLWLAQALGERGGGRPVALVAVADGVHAVVEGERERPEKATLLGACRGISLEVPGLTCRLVDVPATPSEGLARALVDELSAEETAGVVALRGAQRWGPRVSPVALPATEVSGAESPLPGRTWLITGGLGGMGLVFAEHLARTRQARLVLLGRSVPRRDSGELHGEDRERLEKLEALERLGAEVLPLAVDVGDEAQLASALARARECFGRIEGVLHAAGVPGGGALQLQTREQVEAVLRPKVLGALHLGRLLAADPPDTFVLCSSVTSLRGEPGQVAYAAANAFLDGYAHLLRSTGLRAVSVGWDTWGEAGMAVAALRGAGARSTRGLLPGHPLLGMRRVEGEDLVYTQVMAPELQWVLDEHRVLGQPLMPGTGYLEMVVSALTAERPGMAVELSDVVFVTPLTVMPGERREVRLVLSPSGERLRFRVQSRPASSREDVWQEHVLGTARWTEGAARAHPLAQAESRCTDALESAQSLMGDADEHHIFFGPRWTTVDSRLFFGGRELLATFSLSEAYREELGVYRFHPALLDVVTGYSRLLELREKGTAGAAAQGLFLPLTYRRLTVHGPVPARVRVHTRWRHDTEDAASLRVFDITLMDEQGGVVVDVEGFTLKRLDDMHQTFSAPTAEGTPGGAAPGRLTLPGALSNQEGVEALTRILAGFEGAHVYVSRAPLQARAAQRPESTASRKQGAKAPRPAQRTAYVAPRDEVETQVCEALAELLGVEAVGIHDNFYDLGLNSLLMVQLSARLRERLDVQLSLNALLEHSSAAQIGAQVSATRPSSTCAPAAPSEPSLPAGVVRLQRGVPGRTPLFCIHPAGGSVFGFLPLVRHLDEEQPVYGIQARGVEGEVPPDTRIEDMALHYLELVRGLQPEGPYLFCGSSMGGTVAFDMARRLTALGQRVDLLAMLDTPSDDGGTVRHSEPVTDDFVLDYVKKLSPEMSDAFVRMNQENGGSFLRLWRAHNEALLRYAAQPVDTRILYFRASVRDHLIPHHPEYGWIGKARGGIEIHEVEGNHLTMSLEPHVARLASLLRERLAS